MPTSGLLVEHGHKEFIALVEAECKRHESLGFDAAHDATLTPAHWVAILARQVGLAIDDGGGLVDIERLQRQMIRCASVCLKAYLVARGEQKDTEPAGPTVEQRGSQIG